MGRWFAAAFLVGMLAACSASPRQVLRLATTTSTEDSGLLEAILPAFEEAHGARVDVVAAGTGQALELGRRGDADVVLVHSRSAEDQFVADGFGTARYDVMFNDFVMVGPREDPADVAGAATAAEALTRIADSHSTFVSRGDDSGTHAKEVALWAAAGRLPQAESGWYLSLGQGMGETLQMADETLGYTLSDRGTYLSMADTLSSLTIVFGGATIADNPDPELMNPYGVLPVNPAKVPGVNNDLAEAFAEWLTSPQAQSMIGAFGVERFGQPLFYPSAPTS
ncbi:MAG TPA: substrate-binding domain-containing protein [Anaerolineales bacterium]|nr:substrate-binding domain-containing protein [Anaerolineales bacterium]